MVFMQFKCHALGCAPRSHFSIALHWIRSIIAVGVDGDNMVSSLAEFSDGLLKGLQRVPINSEETTTCSRASKLRIIVSAPPIPPRGGDGGGGDGGGDEV